MIFSYYCAVLHLNAQINIHSCTRYTPRCTFNWKNICVCISLVSYLSWMSSSSTVYICKGYLILCVEFFLFKFLFELCSWWWSDRGCFICVVLLNVKFAQNQFNYIIRSLFVLNMLWIAVNFGMTFNANSVEMISVFVLGNVKG